MLSMILNLRFLKPEKGYLSLSLFLKGTKKMQCCIFFDYLRLPPTVVNLMHLLRSMSKGTNPMQFFVSTSVYDHGGYVLALKFKPFLRILPLISCLWFFSVIIYYHAYLSSSLTIPSLSFFFPWILIKW